MRITPLLNTTDPTTLQRLQLVDDWLTSAAVLAKQSRDAEALAVADFLTRQSVLGLPLPDDGIAYAPSKGAYVFRDTVFIVPMLSLDAWRLPPDDRWQYATRPGIGGGDPAGAFLPRNHAIYLSHEWQCSPTWRALIVLHEGLHAYDRIVRRRHMPKPAWRREFNAERLEYRVLCGFGGFPLQRYFDSLVPVAADYYRKHTQADFFVLNDEQLTAPEVLQILGDAVGRSEFENRRLSLSNCVRAHYFIQQESKRAEQMERALVRAWYARMMVTQVH